MPAIFLNIDGQISLNDFRPLGPVAQNSLYDLGSSNGCCAAAQHAAAPTTVQLSSGHCFLEWRVDEHTACRGTNFWSIMSITNRIQSLVGSPRSPEAPLGAPQGSSRGLQGGPGETSGLAGDSLGGSLEDNLEDK